jgi:hypothetical protein
MAKKKEFFPMSSIFSLLMWEAYEGAIVVVNPIVIGGGNYKALSPNITQSFFKLAQV